MRMSFEAFELRRNCVSAGDAITSYTNIFLSKMSGFKQFMYMTVCSVSLRSEEVIIKIIV